MLSTYGQRLCRDWTVAQRDSAQAAVNALMGTAACIQVPGLLQGISFVPSCRYTGSSKEIVETRYPIEGPVFSQTSDYCLSGLQDQRWIPTDPGRRAKIPTPSADKTYSLRSLSARSEGSLFHSHQHSA